MKAINIKIDCTCAGINGCDICTKEISGKRQSFGYFTITRCPVKFCDDIGINRLLPYFWHWKGTNNMQYPDNQGRYEQPSILLEAFSICGAMANKREQIEIDNAAKLNKS
jgi:hypothetical protein